VEPVASADEAVPQKEQKAPPSELLQSLADASSSPEDLKNLMEESFDKFTQEDIESIYSLANEDKENAWKEVLDAFEYVKRTKLLGGKDLLQELLEAGEIRKLDSMVAKAVKDGKITPAFLKVITDNMKAAREEGPEIKANLLTHIYTVVTEELEKATSPGLGLVSRLMRQEDPGIRSNLLNHYLRPQTEILLPDGEKIQLKEPKAALVHPMQFSEGITETVTKLRSMNIQDEELIAGMIEDVRKMAKEGRAVVVEAYPESVVNEFSDSLTPVFKPAAHAAAVAAR
jgi:histidinol phosphatase-like enzyme